MMTAAAGVLGAVAGANIAAAPAAASSATARLDRVRLVSLSHVNDPATTPVFHGDPEFKLTTVATIENDGFYNRYVQEGEHTGTHWGAPGHFQANGALADDLDPGDLFLPAVKIDIRAKATGNADYAVTVDDLKDWERRYGPIPMEAAVILWTGWDERWGTPRYANEDAEGHVHQPGFSLPAAQWLIDKGKLGRRGALGSDTFGPDLGIDETYAVSTLLYDKRRISLENLANLKSLPTTGAWVVPGGPINKRGSGSTANVLAFIPR